jgi:hypothetical protein
MTVATPSIPRRLPPTCCHEGKNRARVVVSTGSTSCRRAASERRLSRRGARSVCAQRPELAFEHAPGTLEPAERIQNDGGAEAIPGGGLGHGERRVGARVAGHEIGDRVGDRLDERVGNPVGNGGAEGVSQPAGIFDGGPALVARDGDDEGAASVDEAGEQIGCVGRGLVDEPRCDLGQRQRPEHSDEVGHAFEVARLAVGGESLQLEFGLGDDTGVEEFAQFCSPQQL